MAKLSPELEEEWVPLQNPFSRSQAVDGHDSLSTAGTFIVSKSETSSCSHISVSFTRSSEENGDEEEEDNWDVTEEMSFEKLELLHRQLVELYPESVDENSLPKLPAVPRGVWSYLTSITVRDGLYQEIADYLNTAAAECSVESVLAVFFAESAFWSPEKYEEKWNELNRKQYLEEKENAERELNKFLARRSETKFKSMKQVHSFYEEEDILSYQLDRVEDKLQSFQVKPFQDLCDIAQRRRDEVTSQITARSEEEAPPVLDQVSAVHEERRCHEQYLEARESLHELKIEHCRWRAERLECKLMRAQEDKEHLGTTLWDEKAECRMDAIENRLNQTVVEMLRVQCQRLADQKDHALLDMALVQQGVSMEAEVLRKEDQVYQIQLRLYEIRLRLLEEEERKLKLQLKYAESESERQSAIANVLESLPSKMSKLRLKIVSHNTPSIFC